MIAGKDSPRFGEAKNSWLTGTSAWAFLSISQAILGIVPDYDGLRIQPCLPSCMDGFKATRLFRGTVYNITVQRVESADDAGLWVNGEKKTAGPIEPTGSEIKVLLKI